MAFFVVLDSFELQMMAELIKGGGTIKCEGLFGCRSLGNDLRTTFFRFAVVLGSKEEGGRRNERKKWDAFL